MKKFICALVAASFVLIATLAEAADEAQQMKDRATILQLAGFEARRTMLEVCGVTGDEADKYLAYDIAAQEQLEESLSDEARKTLRAELAHARAAVKASWEATPEEHRTKACEQLKVTMSR
jgi:hypothetical protein